MSGVGRVLRNFWIAPLLGAALLWASFPPLDLGVVAGVLGWALFFTSMRLRGGERAGRQALVGHFVFFLAGISFLLPLMAAGWAFVALWCAAFEAIFARCLVSALRRARNGGDATWAIAAPLLHVGFDMVRTVLFTGFPWLLPGYAGWTNPVLLGSADLLGVHGATIAVVGLGAGLAELAARRIEGTRLSFRPVVPAAALWGVFACWALVKPAPEERDGPTMLLLQASIDQQLKEDLVQQGREGHGAGEYWRAHEDQAAAGLRAAAAAGRPVDLVVWPETMIPYAAVAPLVPGRIPQCVEPAPAPQDWRLGSETIRRVALAADGRPTLAGIVTMRPLSPEEGGGERLRNSAILIDADGRLVASQDKQHLTPGGETLLFIEWFPKGAREPLERWLKGWVGFVPSLEPGDGPVSVPLAWRGGTARLGVLICYESIFPEISREMVRGGADVLVNVSNYGWFTGTPQMDQALAMAAFRAAELRRPMVLASNNGISAVVGPDGRVRAATAPDVRTHLLADVPLSSGTSLFALVGERAAWVLGLSGAVLLAWKGARKLREAPETS